MTQEHKHKHPHKRKTSPLSYIPLAAVLLVCVVFIIKYAGPSILKLYIQAGIGDCKKIPVFCMVPSERMDEPRADEEAVADFIPYEFPKMSVSVPRGFIVVQELITKVYYKRRGIRQVGPAIYFTCQEPDFFVGLYPQLKKRGIKNDYEFIKRVMNARFSDIKTLEDAFFVVIKGVFLPDLGDQSTVKMAEFSFKGKKGFIAYNQTRQGNFYVVDLIAENGFYFKLYIKDKDAKLDLAKVFAIISTLKSK